MGVQTHRIAPHPVLGVRLSDVQRSLTVTAKLAMCLEPEFDQVSISVVDRTGEVSTWAQDGELAIELDRLQYDLGEGPCIDSIRSAERVVAPHIRQAGRWARYVPAAVELGLRCQVSAPLRWRGNAPLGALTMYSTIHDHLGLTAPLVAEVLAAQVATVLASLREIDHLHNALDASATIGQATGLVMAWLEVDAEHAAEYLRRMSMLTDRRLAQVAEDLVRTRQLPSVPPA